MFYYLTFEVQTSRVINVPKGSTSSIITYLDKKNYDINIIDKYILISLGHPQSGWIDLKSTNMTKADFLHKLTTSKAALKKVTLIPGETYYFFLQELADTLNISTIKLFDTYARYAYKKDGNIIADTYHLPLGMDETQLIKHLFLLTENRYKTLSNTIFGEYNKKNWYKYLTIASIIQKESASKDEMSTISSVIYNRVKKDMKLQMDGTLNYSKYSHTKVTPTMIKEDKSEYNTYKNKGIPKNPICAVELASIKAAIFPIKSDYLYFVKSSDAKSHLFSNNYKDHKRNIRKLKIYNKKKKKRVKTRIKKSNTKKNKKPKIIKQDKKVTTKNLKDLWN
ncbi:MAG: endolytic transglycosylase MltG [Campylobacterota bacterium]|nr:endolytic transglycosylase MltG [Campylobacterota bacterium]